MMRTHLLLLAVFGGCSTSSNDLAEQPRGGERTEMSPPPTIERGIGDGDDPNRARFVGPNASAPVPCAGPPRTLRTLVIGNSQIYFWNLPRILSELSQTAPPSCPRIEAEGFTRGGQNLYRLWTGGDSLGRDLEETIRAGRYDVVVIAESIDLVDLAPPKTQFVTYAGLIIDAARAAGAMPVLYATPYADQTGHRNFVEMAEPQLALGLARDVRVAAGGLAWLRVWKELPDIDLHHPDNAHPGYNGSIVSAMVIYSVVTRVSSLALTLPGRTECEPRPGQSEPCPAVSAAEADVFRAAAWAEATSTGMARRP